MKKIKDAADKLIHYIESENYKGYDPYDGLHSYLFSIPILGTNKKIRFLGQQFIKRFPINIRPLLGIQKGLNPVTAGLCLQAYGNMWESGLYDNKSLQEKINFLMEYLDKSSSKKFHGRCWGYDFDWQARYADIPAFEPTVVATGFITNALYRLYQQTGNITAKEWVISACDFVLSDLNKSYDTEGDFCFSYSPFDKEQVFNASMKGARLLAQGYDLTKQENFKTQSRSAVAWVMKHQRSDGAWIYSNSKAGTWIDNYHTGYNLDCLEAYTKLCNDNTFQEQLNKGLEFYKLNFFEKSGQPKFYDKEAWPADCTAAGQSILTLCRFNEIEMAKKCAEWTIQNMQDQQGYFYFRKFSNRITKTSFMRWSNAWMAAALTEITTADTRK
jgi:hypothetical protein